MGEAEKLTAAADHMRPILEMYEREARVRLPGRGRERFAALADALRTLIGGVCALAVVDQEARAALADDPAPDASPKP